MSERAANYQTVHHDAVALDALIAARRKRKRISPARRLTYVNFATLLTCLLFLYDGHEPGWSVFTCVSMLMFSALTIAWAVASFQWLIDDDRTHGLWTGVLRMTVAPILTVACGAMVIMSIPARIGLWASLNDFQPLLKNAPAIADGEALNKRVGVYDVLRYAADGKGGVYFVTGNYRDGLRRNQVSLGFAYHPSRQGTPFGRDQYRLIHVSGDWYSFAASEPAR